MANAPFQLRTVWDEPDAEIDASVVVVVVEDGTVVVVEDGTVVVVDVVVVVEDGTVVVVDVVVVVVETKGVLLK